MKRKLTLITLLAIGGFFLVTPFIQTYRPISSYDKANSPVVLVQATEANIDSTIPKKLYPCLPKKVEKLRLFASHTTEQDTYYLIGIYQPPQPHSPDEAPPPTYEETIVKLDKLGCLVIVPKEKIGEVSLTEFVPESVARSLSLQRYQKAIEEVGGKEKYQQVWNEGDVEAGDVSYLFPEDAWALKQLGINVPSNVRVVTDVEQLSNSNQ